MTQRSGHSRFVTNKGVRIHYYVSGGGPPIILLHGFPEYWNVWRNQIENLSRDHCVIVPDLRGFNLSDSPAGVEQYTVAATAQDVFSILADLNLEKAVLVGHDVGGMIAWWVAGHHPHRVERLALLSAPHPIEYILGRKSAAQREASSYVDKILGSSGADFLQPARLSFWIDDRQLRAELEEALTRSDLQAAANYFRANLHDQSEVFKSGIPRIGCPTLVLYGSEDRFVLQFIYERTKEWVEGPLTIKVLTGKGHFIHHDAASEVTAELRRWLAT